MRLLMAVLAVMTLVKPALAADEAKPDMMDWYQDQRKATLERTIKNEQQYKDRWTEHVKDRYGITLDQSAAGAADTDKESTDKEKIAAAKKVFEKYKAYERAYDPAILDLYSEDVRLDVTLVHQSGAVRSGTLSGDRYKEAIKRGLQITKIKGETMTYKDVAYAEEGSGIRISATISFAKKKFSMPWSILVEPDEKGTWLIM
jgi:hypothetical protein